MLSLCSSDMKSLFSLVFFISDPYPQCKCLFPGLKYTTNSRGLCKPHPSFQHALLYTYKAETMLIKDIITYAAMPGYISAT